MKEMKNLRKSREKHFLKEDGTMVAYVYADDIHYLKNGVYEEMIIRWLGKKKKLSIQVMPTKLLLKPWVVEKSFP